MSDIKTAPRGFATATPEQRVKMASAGGKASQSSGKGRRWTSETAKLAAAKSAEVRRTNKFPN